MKYFETLPKIVETQNNISTVKTNLMARSSVIPTLLSNPAVFYQYDIQDDDTPEIIAFKYYGNVYNYWIVLFTNQILNPQWDWPLKSGVFTDYLNDKYPNIDIYATLDHYEKIITTTDGETNTTTSETFTISFDEYSNLAPTTTTYNIDGVNCTVSITKRPVNLYQMEFELNESKRNIKILNSNYITQVETEFAKLFKNKK
jgi:hypothetical protein